LNPSSPRRRFLSRRKESEKRAQGKTLTALSSYWKGRKPLILVRAIVLGSLLPPTGDAEGDLEIFEKLMAFDDEGLARRALAANAFSPKEIAARIEPQDPWEYFKAKICSNGVTGGDIRWMTFRLDCDAEGITLRWQRQVTDDDKLILYRQALATFSTYEAKAALCKRPEEVYQDWLYAPVWPAINRHYTHTAARTTRVFRRVPEISKYHAKAYPVDASPPGVRQCWNTGALHRSWTIDVNRPPWLKNRPNWRKTGPLENTFTCWERNV
jgi:hypothetical protein